MVSKNFRLQNSLDSEKLVEAVCVRCCGIVGGLMVVVSGLVCSGCGGNEFIEVTDDGTFLLMSLEEDDA